MAGEAGAFFELLGGDFVAVAADGSDLKVIEPDEFVHAFDENEAVAVEGFFDPRFLKSRGVASVEFEAAVEAGDVAVFAGFPAFRFAIRRATKGWVRRRHHLWIGNIEHWKQLRTLLSKHQVTFKLIKGHAGHAENDRCDIFAVDAAERARYSS